METERQYRERHLVYTFTVVHQLLALFPVQFEFDLPPEARELIAYWVGSPVLPQANRKVGSVALKINSKAQHIFSGYAESYNPATQLRKTQYMELTEPQELNQNSRIQGMFRDESPNVAIGAAYTVKIYLKVHCDV